MDPVTAPVAPTTPTLFDKLKAMVDGVAVDYTKAKNGVKLAGTRVRGTMQDVRALALEIRKEVLSTRKASAKPVVKKTAVTPVPATPAPAAAPAAPAAAKKVKK